MSEKLWPEAHPDVIRTALPYEPHHLGIRVVETEADFRAAMTYVSGAKVSDGEREEVERIAGHFAHGYRVLLVEAYPEAYAMLLQTLQVSYVAMVPYVRQQRRKRASEN